MKENNFSVFIDEICFSILINCVYLNVSIELGRLKIFNIQVSYEKKEDKIKISLPHTRCSGEQDSYVAIEFLNIDDWVHVRTEIENQLRSLDWFMSYFHGL